MNAPSKDIKDMLITEFSLGLTFGTNLFIGKIPASSKNCVCIYDTPGIPNSLTLLKSAYERPSIQIRVRNIDYTEGWNLIEAIKDFLQKKLQETIGTTLYTLITVASGPSFLEYDENGIANFVLNLNIQRIDLTEEPSSPNLFTGFTTLGDGWTENVDGSYTCDGTQTATSFLVSELTLEAGEVYLVDITALDLLGIGFLTFLNTSFSDAAGERIVANGSEVKELTATGGAVSMSIADTLKGTININSIRKKV